MQESPKIYFVLKSQLSIKIFGPFYSGAGPLA